MSGQRDALLVVGGACICSSAVLLAWYLNTNRIPSNTSNRSSNSNSSAGHAPEGALALLEELRARLEASEAKSAELSATLEARLAGQYPSNQPALQGEEDITLANVKEATNFRELMNAMSGRTPYDDGPKKK